MSEQTSLTSRQREYFPALDGLRFISILFVVLHHLDTFRGSFFHSTISFPLIWEVGYFSIQFFFVASGFLITLFLLTEIRDHEMISPKKYFMRRILRIWPGYYLLLLFAVIGFFIFPVFSIPGTSDEFYTSQTFYLSSLCFIFFLPHLPPFFSTTAPFIHQTYTIGIEEQFYLGWGIIFWLFKKNGLKVIAILAMTVLILELWHDLYFYLYGAPKNGTIQSFLCSVATYFRYSRITTFSIGSIFAYWHINKSRWLRVYSISYIQLIFIVGLGVLLTLGYTGSFMADEIISVAMISLLMFSINSSISWLRFSHPLLVFLGKISYGIYLFHMFAIVLAVKFVILFSDKDSIFHYFILSVLTAFLSILFGFLSYEFFEKPILRLKKNYMS